MRTDRTPKVALLFATRPLSAADVPGAVAKLKKGLGRRTVRHVRRIPSHGGRVALTPRQTETLRYIVHGCSTREISFELGVSAKTVETHRKLLMERVGSNRVPDLVRFALAEGIVPVAWLFA